MTIPAMEKELEELRSEYVLAKKEGDSFKMYKLEKRGKDLRSTVEIQKRIKRAKQLARKKHREKNESIKEVIKSAFEITMVGFRHD